mmetsp:Transcript_5866/g.27141  ORF Transcript_5866/g.27141 Transcript_5866/m.27141 type:complete len:445 (-) Transcript_5866:1149-2483(-)
MTETWNASRESMCAALTAASIDASTIEPLAPNRIFSSHPAPPPAKSIADSSAAAAWRFMLFDRAASNTPIAACAVRTAAASFAGLGAPPDGPPDGGRGLLPRPPGPGLLSSSDADVQPALEAYPPNLPGHDASTPRSSARTLASAASPGRFATRSRALSAGSLSHVALHRACDTTCASSPNPSPNLEKVSQSDEAHDLADRGVSGADDETACLKPPPPFGPAFDPCSSATSRRARSKALVAASADTSAVGSTPSTPRSSASTPTGYAAHAKSSNSSRHTPRFSSANRPKSWSSSRRLPSADARECTAALASARSLHHAGLSLAALAESTASSITSSNTNEPAATSSAASRSAAPHPPPRVNIWSPRTLRKASTAWGSTSLPSSTMASSKRSADSPGSTEAPNLVSQPAQRRLGRTAALRSDASSAGISAATALSSVAHSARKGR